MPPAWLTRGYLNAALTMIAEGWGMNFLDLARAIFALAITLGIIGFAAWASRRYLPQLLARISAERGERRMTVVETLVLDPARRLVLVRIDHEERLLILGEGRELIEPRGPEAAK